MPGVKFKPVPGYGGALDDFNQIPVLTVADRVRRDIVLPVLGYRFDSALVEGGSQFMGSANGSLLKRRQPVVLADLWAESFTLIVGAARAGFKPPKAGWWYSVNFHNRDDDSVSVKLYSGSDDEIYKITFGDPILWLPRIFGRLYLRAVGNPVKRAYVHVNQYG